VREPPRARNRVLRDSSYDARVVNERMTFDGRRALRAGLSYRPLSETGRATLEWWRAQIPERRAAAAKYWPTAEQEKAVLEHMSWT
jgi:hypothetical protein